MHVSKAGLHRPDGTVLVSWELLDEARRRAEAGEPTELWAGGLRTYRAPERPKPPAREPDRWVEPRGYKPKRGVRTYSSEDF